MPLDAALFSTRGARLLAAVVFVASIAALATDLIRTSIVAERYSTTLCLELDQLVAPNGVRRSHVERFHKARLATVTALYVGDVSKEEVLGHYKELLEARGWLWCGRFRVGDIYSRETTTREVFCRGDSRATVEWGAITSGKSGTYSVTLEWNRITWGVWAASVGLIWTAVLSTLVLARGFPTSWLDAWRRFRTRHPVRPRTGLPPPNA